MITYILSSNSQPTHAVNIITLVLLTVSDIDLSSYTWNAKETH